MKKFSELDYSNVPGIKGSFKILMKSIIRKFYLAPLARARQKPIMELSLYFDKKYETIRNQVRLARILRQNVVFVCGTPTHGNIGDRAISLAEYYFIKKSIKRSSVIMVPSQIYFRTGRLLPDDLITEDDLIVLHGGGNMGNVYIIEEELRRAYIGKYLKNKIIIFPQTINFSKKFDSYNKEIDATKLIYSRHKDLTIIAREETSYNTMKDLFPNNKVIISPDIVLSYSPKIKRVLNPRYDAITIMRTDFEKILSEAEQSDLFAVLEGMYGKSRVSHTDMQYSDRREDVDDYEIETMDDQAMVYGKLEQISNARIVVTDRLHGMIFAAILGKPCIAFSNHDWKVEGVFRKWLSGLNANIFYCKNLDAATEALHSIDSMTNNETNYSPHVFDEYWDEVANQLTKKG